MRKARFAVIAGLIVAVLSGLGCDSYDLAPPDFVGGIEVLDGGDVAVHFGKCSAAPLRRFTLYHRHGEREQTARIVLGRVPPGFVENIPYGADLPCDALLNASLNFTDEPSATVGVFFRWEDLKKGEIWTNDRDYLDLDDFRDRIEATCD